MYFVKKLRHDILLQPCYLDKYLKTSVRSRLIKELEGQCLGKHGYVISVLSVQDSDIIPGIIDNDSGCVNVVVWFDALLLRPFKNEVLDAIVVTASEEVRFFPSL